MKPRFSNHTINLFLLGIALAGLAFFGVSLWLQRAPNSASVDYHQWIHDQLQLTSEQEERLRPSEEKYETQARQLRAKLRAANRELAEAIKSDRSNSPRVQHAVATIHSLTGELQIVTLEHIFEMQEVLSPGQYDHLLNLAADALMDQTHPEE